MKGINKILLIILAAETVILIFRGYQTQILGLLWISNIILMVLLYGFIFNQGRVKKIKTFQFLIGDFNLKEDINIIQLVYRKVSIYNHFYALTSVISIIFLLFIIYVSVQFLFTVGIGLISIGIALGILNFNYFNTLENKKDKKLVLAGAKRFFIVAILGLFALFSTAILLISSPLPTILSKNIFDFIVIYFKTLIYILNTLLIILLLPNALRFLIEGLILSFKGIILFDS